MEMNYRDFKKQVRRYPVITSAVLAALGEDERILRNQLSRWNQQGLIVQLKKGLYLLNRDDRAIQPSRFFLANQMVFPSYVSLESALAFYHIIPEAVYQVTSVTTAKPRRYATPEGTYTFRHVKPAAFFGFETHRNESGFEVLIADPEKALLDFIYLNLAQFSPGDSDIFSEPYRFAGHEILRAERLTDYAARFGSKKLQQVVQLFVDVHLSGEVHA